MTSTVSTMPSSTPLGTTYLPPIVSAVNYDKLNEFEFTPPPECPVFRPTKEEFAMGPIEYINKIRPQAEPHGICKIIPPKDFQVPFAVDINEFRFTPRTQRLNELEALTRIKLNFHDRIHKFWDLQGVTLRIPTVEKRLLDLYTLHVIVKEEGGFEICTRDRKWAKIAIRMKYTKSSASTFRSYYEKVLFPYDIFQSGATIGPEIKDSMTQSMKDMNINGNNNGNVGHKEEFNNEVNNSELKKLQVYGAGPKMPGIINDEKIYKNKCCFNCNESNQYSSLLTCNKCQYSFHKFCLIPPFNDVPKGNWHCHRCLAQLIKTLPQLYTSEFGFAQSLKTYTLNDFGEMANEFKSNYFNSPPHEVLCSVLEKEFWRIVSTPYENNVCVEYGADLHTNDYGSGFPTKTSDHYNGDMTYVNSPWNLNNLPTLNGSVFKHINTNINGMIIPWMYVGMCFSAFCWHNEDHWTYSINYLHWGEPKTWYGVPGEKAELFENAMRQLAPDLFHSQPDLLHQLVTTCNPNLLIKLDVPIFRTNQQAGEFVVTFPRSYHSGFNQGLNFAEAVNFASSDWLPTGRLSIAHYASLHRYPVFSHDELVCKMADEPDVLDNRLANSTYDDIKRMIESEKNLRNEVLLNGITSTERCLFENYKDDERQCDHCKTTCFLSAICCGCNKTRFACLYHYDHLCKGCPRDNYILMYRYSLDELKIMENKLNEHINCFNDWNKKATKSTKEGEVFKCYRNRIDSWKKSLDDAIHNDPQFRSYLTVPKSVNLVPEDVDENNPSFQMLQRLLFQGIVLESNLDEIQLLWNAYTYLRPKWKTVIFFSNTIKRKLITHETKVKKPRKNDQSAISPNEQKEGKKSDVIVSYDGVEYDENDREICAMKENCRKPNDDTNNWWVMCDNCKKWYHHVCQGITPDQIDDEELFMCLSCRNI